MSNYTVTLVPLFTSVSTPDTPAGRALQSDVCVYVDEHMRMAATSKHATIEFVRRLLVGVHMRYFAADLCHYVVAVNRDGEQPAASCTYVVGDVRAALIAAKVLVHAHPLCTVEVGIVSERLRFYVAVDAVISALGL